MHFFEVFTEVVTANRATSDTQTQNISHPFVVEKVINNSPNKIYSDFPWLFCLTKQGKSWKIFLKSSIGCSCIAAKFSWQRI